MFKYIKDNQSINESIHIILGKLFKITSKNKKSFLYFFFGE